MLKNDMGKQLLKPGFEKGRGAAPRRGDTICGGTAGICSNHLLKFENEKPYMIELERVNSTFQQTFSMPDKLSATTAKFFGPAAKYFCATAQFCAPIAKYFGATAQFCGTTAKYFGAIDQFFAETAQFFAATKQFFAVTEQFCAATERFHSMTRKNVSTAGERYPAIEKTSRTYKYKGKWAVRMCIYPYPNVKKN